MARHRVNKRLLVMLVGGLILLVGFGWGWWQGRMRQRDPRPYLVMGDELFAQGQYKEATVQYSQASRWAATKGDTATQVTALVKISRALPHIETEHAVLQAVSVLEQAVTKDPQSIEARKARLEMQYERTRDIRDPQWLGAWQDLQQYADDLIELISLSAEKKLDEDNARAHYLRGLATLTVIEMQRDTTPLEVLKTRQEALEFVAKAYKYHPSSVDYCKALMQTHMRIADQISIIHTPLPKEDRTSAVKHLYEAQNIAKRFCEQNPNSGAALALLTDELYQVKAWSERDQRDEVAEDPQISSGLDDRALLEAYLKAWADNSARPALSEVNSAADRLIEEYLQEAEKLGTDIVSVQLTKAIWWQHPSRRDLDKVRVSLEKAADHESDIISKLGLYLQIADAYKQDGQRRKALKICEQAVTIPLDLGIVRARALRWRIRLLHQSAAQILVELNSEITGTDASAVEEVNTLLDRAEEHLEASLAIIEGRLRYQYPTLIVRGQIAQLRRPKTRQNNRQAIQLYEQARDEMENMSAVALRQNILQYSRLLVRLAQAYNVDGQSGAAEESLSKAVKTVRLMLSSSKIRLTIGPPTMLFLADLQLKNRHVDKAEQTLDEAIEQISQSPGESDEKQAKLLGEALRRRIRQFELQDKTQDALATAQYIEEHYPEMAEWAIARQVEILGQEQQTDSVEMEAVLKRWMALRPDSSAPVRRLTALYLRLEQYDKAEALVQKTIAENPELGQVLSQMTAIIRKTDREERQQMLRKLLKDTSDPLQRHMSLFRLYRQDYSYYNAQAIKHAQEGKTELAEEARKQATQNSELAMQSLEQVYEIRAGDPSVHQTLLSYYLAGRDWEKAEKIVARAEEENWDGVEGLYSRGRLHNAKGESLASEDEQAANKEYQKALKCLEEAVQRRKKFYQGWLEKARAEHHLERHEAALESARIAIGQNPTDHTGVRMLLVLTAGEWNRAKTAENPAEARRFAEETYELAQQALKLDPNYHKAELFKRAYLDEYDTDRAIKERLALLEKDPSDRANLQHLLGIYQREKKIEELRQVLVALIAKQPDSPELVLLLAKYYNQIRQYDEALGVLQSAQQQWPERLSVAVTLAETYRLNNEPDKATACLQSFLSRTKEEEKGRAYQLLGLLEARLGRQENALRAFQQAIANAKQYRPEDLKAVCNLSRLMFNSGARQAAIATVLPLAENDNKYAIQMLVHFYRHNAEPEESIKWARRGLSLFPESLDQKIILAAALLAGNKPAEAQELLENVVEQVGGGAGATDAYVMLARAHTAQRQYQAAIRMLEQAINSGVNQPKVRLELAILYRFEGKIGGAARQYQLVLEKHPGNRVVRQVLADLWISQGRYAQAEIVLEKGREVETDEYFWPSQLSRLWLSRTDKPAEQRGDKALDYALEAATKSGNDSSRVAEVMAVLNLRGQYNRCVAFYEATVPEAHKHNYRILMNLARAERGRWGQGKSASSPTMSTQELEQLKRRTVALYRQALDKAEGDWTTYNMVTRELEAMLGLDEVIESSEIWASKNPGDTHNRTLLAMLLSRRAQKRLGSDQEAQANADLNRAVGLLQSLVQQGNLSVSIRLTAERQLAEIYFKLEMYEQARSMYTKVLRVLPNDIASLNNLAYILTDMLNKPEEALEYIEKALQQNPQEPNLLDTYGWALLKAGQTNRAIEKLSRSVSAGASGINNYHLGLALKEAGEHRRALKALREAEKLLENDATYKEQIGAEVRALIEELEQE